MRWPRYLLMMAVSATQPALGNEAYAELYRLYDYPQTLSRKAVPVCMHHGCATVKRVPIDDAQWARVTRHLQPPAPDAAAEREQIRRTIAEFETLTGLLAGTAEDRGGDLRGLGTFAPQLDCIDESSNTTTYLTLLEQQGLLRWHTVERRAQRGYLFFGGWPHYTAVVREKSSGQPWVVDSWFRDNGEPPDIVALDEWKAGWEPEDSDSAPEAR